MSMQMKSIISSFTAILLLIPVPTSAYVNGGTFHSTLVDFQKYYKAGGWGSIFESPMPSRSAVAAGIPFDPPDNAEFLKFVNQIVARAVKQLPEKDADAVSLEAKRELARLAREAILSAGPSGVEKITRGTIGSLEYHLGAVGFSSHWETNYSRKGKPHREIHAARAGLVPFVALRIETGEKAGNEPE